MDIKQVIVMRKDLGMRKGKMISQGAHASMKVLLDRFNLHVSGTSYDLNFTLPMIEWVNGSFKKIVVGVDSEHDLMIIVAKAKNAKIPVAIIEDNGLTEFHGVLTKTCCAVGPAESEDIDKITGHLTLL